jgi:hypothetical protein
MRACTNKTGGEVERKDATDCSRDKGRRQGGLVASIVCKWGCRGSGDTGDGAWGVKKNDGGCASDTYEGSGSMLMISGKRRVHHSYRATYC